LGKNWTKHTFDFKLVSLLLDSIVCASLAQV